MTENHNYETPEQGQTDWHIPLNQNFEAIDTDVEVRDRATNRNEYTPKEGALFRATDTGGVYIGDGSSWSPLNPPSGAETGHGVLYADPGEVQTAIDDAATDSTFGGGVYRTVRLRSGTIYQPSETWHLKRGVALDFNGARVEPDGDFDVIHQWPESTLLDAYIDVRGRAYSSRVITLDGDFDGKYSGPNRAAIRNARLLANPGDGVGIELRDTTEQNVSDTYVEGSIQGFDTCINLEATGGPAAFVNSNHFTVKLMNYRVGVNQEAVTNAAVNGNFFDVNTQPYGGSSEWLWDLGREAGFNTFQAMPWDKQMYENETLWRLSGDVGPNNTLVDRFGILNDSNVVDSSGVGSNVLFNYK
jgi:hypothetical protein